MNDFMSSVIATDYLDHQASQRTKPSLTAHTRTRLNQAFQTVRQRTEMFAARFSAEDQNIQSMADASPLKWHRAHTSWFFETFLLKPYLKGYASPDPLFTHLFNSYYNGVGTQYPRAQRHLISRPDCDAVGRYREHVDAAIADLVSGFSADELERIAPLVILGLNHEQQHQELMVTDIKHGLSFNPSAPSWATRAQHQQQATPSRWIEFSGGLHQFGSADHGFAFDNEGPRHASFVHPFALATRPVSCGDYLAFIDDDGYSRPELWLSDGWAWCRGQESKAPLYWRKDNQNWYHYTAAGMVEVSPSAPVCHLNFYEACAFAQWSDARLPSEYEWELVAATQRAAGHFSDRELFQPTAAQTDEPELAQLYGDVWEWTTSSYAPYPGFKPANGAVGEYNGKFMANQMVLRGGSCATPADHIRATYRNFFYPADRWQFSGIRLARNLT